VGFGAGEGGVEQGSEGVAGRVVGPEREDTAWVEVFRQGEQSVWLVERGAAWMENVLR
jgi:hypothetical protein